MLSYTSRTTLNNYISPRFCRPSIELCNAFRSGRASNTARYYSSELSIFFIYSSRVYPTLFSFTSGIRGSMLDVIHNVKVASNSYNERCVLSDVLSNVVSYISLKDSIIAMDDSSANSWYYTRTEVKIVFGLSSRLLKLLRLARMYQVGTKTFCIGPSDIECSRICWIGLGCIILKLSLLAFC